MPTVSQTIAVLSGWNEHVARRSNIASCPSHVRWHAAASVSQGASSALPGSQSTPLYGVVNVRGGCPQPPEAPLAPLLAPLDPLVPLDDAPLVPLDDAPLVPLDDAPLVPLEPPLLAPLDPPLLAPPELAPLDPSSREIRSDPTVAPPQATERSADAGAAAAIEKRSLESDDDFMPPPRAIDVPA